MLAVDHHLHIKRAWGSRESHLCIASDRVDLPCAISRRREIREPTIRARKATAVFDTPRRLREIIDEMRGLAEAGRLPFVLPDFGCFSFSKRLGSIFGRCVVPSSFCVSSCRWMILQQRQHQRRLLLWRNHRRTNLNRAFRAHHHRNPENRLPSKAQSRGGIEQLPIEFQLFSDPSPT